jgi:phytoene synthase
MTPDQYCQDKAAASGSSFYHSFRFLPRSRRRAITALYAFCREVDDVVDECRDPQVAQAKLQWWRGEIDAVFRGQPQHPVSRALQPAVQAFGLGEQPFREIIAGMEMDLTHNRYPDFAALDRYCYRVAGAVGELAAAIFGRATPAVLDYARALGLAFQLTNILRDVGEDARRGRIYLPLDELARFGVTEEDILAGRESDAFRALMAFQAQRAKDTYARAFAALPKEERRAQLPGLVMAATYQALLREIEADGFRVLTHRTSLGPGYKLWLALKAWIKG